MKQSSEKDTMGCMAMTLEQSDAKQVCPIARDQSLNILEASGRFIETGGGGTTIPISLRAEIPSSRVLIRCVTPFRVNIPKNIFHGEAPSVHYVLLA